MKKLLACLTLVGGLGAAAFLETPATAQSKKSGTGSIKVLQNKAGKYYFQIRNGEDKFLCQSAPGGYATEKEALAALEELKKIVADVKPVVDKTPPKTDKDESKPKKKAG